MDRLILAMNGLEIGVLERGGSGAMRFAYYDQWLSRPGARPISLSLPLSSRPFRGERAYNFFDNLLPDSDAIRARIQARYRTPTRQPFDLLTEIGRDCIGAIQLYPEGSSVGSVHEITAEPLDDDDVARLLDGYTQASPGEQEQAEFRISLAGAQEKTALLFYQGRWHRPLGSTPTSHILKLPIGRIEHSGIDLTDSIENEWICSQILRAFGLPIANSQIANFEGRKVLVVERFDRRWSSDGSWLMRLPQEDFCQALGVAPARKYESDGGPGIRDGMELLLGSQQPIEDRETFFRSQIIFWLLAAIDGHAKNFSLFLEPAGAYRMTPLYDVLSVHPLMANGTMAKQKASMAMAWEGKNRHYRWEKIQQRHILNTASRAGLSHKHATSMMEDIRERVPAVIDHVDKILPSGFPPHIVDPIIDGLKRQARCL